MKVLFYNWTPLNIPNEGGGVAVYLKNVLKELAEKPQYGIEPVFLSSGYFYDNTSRTHLRQDNDYLGIKVFTIVNSPIIAPLRTITSNLKSIKKDNVTKKIFEELIQNEGPFDVIHFQTFEGISPNVLSLKKKYPATHFIHSIHDYGIICPNVRLWTMNGENCYRLNKKPECRECMKYWLTYTPSYFIHRRPTEQSLSQKPKVIQRAYDKVMLITKRLLEDFNWTPEKTFDNYRLHNLSMINQYSDLELCVSNRVAEIIKHAGINPIKTCVNYIGTKAADNATYKCNTDPYSQTFTIIYMGYSNLEKGFSFLLDALELLDDESSKKIVFKIATTIKDQNLFNRIETLRPKFKEIVLFNGYTHKDFPQIMDSVNLGIVPPLWEDNLPQVAIEMISHGIPVITSNNGGAHELNSHPSFTFESCSDLACKIINIKNNRNLLIDYWKFSKKLTSMGDHINNLLLCYNDTPQHSHRA